MGVSSAILENVIFCHQDEALWPFSDQANLKKIFDEIFDTSIYTKQLVELRALQKMYTKQMKENRVQLDLLKKDFDQYCRLQEESKGGQARANEKIGAMKQVKKCLQEVEEELKQIDLV